MSHHPQALVLGLGLSGEAASRLLAAEGWQVTAVDLADTPILQARARALRVLGVTVHLAAHELPQAEWGVAVPSPGLPPESPWLSGLRARGVPLIPEFELGWSRFRGRTIAVTGSNGKSSVVKWLADALGQAGLRAVAVGNIGLPVCTAVMADPPPDWLVIEVSSFQLEQAQAFRPDIGVLLNLVPNHLDRHGTFDRYVAAKARLFDPAAGAATAILPLDWSSRLAGSGARPRLTFGASPAADFHYDQGLVWQGGQPGVDLRDTYFGNDVLGVNAAAGVAALASAGVTLDCAMRAARAFAPLPHRMQEVAAWRGVRFINDSKATTLSALSAALAMSGGKAHLIAGGRLKETDLAGPKKMLVEHAAAVYLVGEAADQFAHAWADAVPCVMCGRLADAVPRAAAAARTGETVLLSPGCASFDQFASYAERGDQFRHAVLEWIRNNEP
jgi:UDP-N-acetylmuramoylalanine--D-glutamate ligase